MKISHKTLMLGILMGLLAWVVDAAISWYFFPGKTFFEMLYAYDPERTFYVRSTVVLLFFVFGLLTGKLVSTLEQNHKILEEKNRLLESIRTVHEKIVQVEDEKMLVEEVLPLLIRSFELKQASYYPFKDGKLPAGKESTPGREDFSPVLAKLEEMLPVVLNRQRMVKADVPNEPEDSRSYFIPLQHSGFYFGVIYVAVSDDYIELHPERVQHLEAVCNDLGHALAHFQDHHELQQTAEKLTSFTHDAPVGIFSSNVGGELLFANRAMAQILGARTPEELMNANFPISSFYVNPKRRYEMIEALKLDGAIVDFEADLIGLTKEEKTVLIAARLKAAATEEDAVIEGFIMDMTQSRNAERSNRVLQKRLSEAHHFKSITVLAGGVAHEFNNILQAMIGSAYLAQLKTSDENTHVLRYLQDIQDSGKRAAKLCDQMLSYAGKKTMLLKLEEPDACLKTTLKMIIAQTDNRIKFQKEFEAPDVQVRMDIPAFSEIVSQLVTNAIESLEDDEGTIQISTEVLACDEKYFQPYHMYRGLGEDSYWALKIVDDGIGISEKDLTHIFEPFFTTKFQGRGLGLPSIAGMVEKFDGSIGVRDAPVKGTEFVMWLPLAQTVLVEENDDQDVPLQEKKITSEAGKIWVADDEPLICMTVQRLLTRLGVEVGTASNGKEVLEKLKEEPPETLGCLILDVTMPQMGGLETLQNVREFLPDLPVLIMSGYDEHDSLQNFKDLNITGFIHKPFRMEQLQEKLSEFL